MIALVRIMNRYVGNLAPMPGVFPDYQAPVIRNTESGTELAMLRWGNRYKVDDPPLQLVHKNCGHMLEPVTVCESCKEEVHRHDLLAYFAPDAW